jgi:hypothetical protein
MHVRKQIRDYVAAQLAGLPTTGDNVFIGRTRALAADHPPTLLIYARREDYARDAMGRPPIIMRTLALFVHGKVVASAPPDDTLDQIAVEVERKLGADDRLGGLVLDCVMTSSEIIVTAEGASHVGEIAMEYRVKYRTTQTDPEMTA